MDQTQNERVKQMQSYSAMYQVVCIKKIKPLEAKIEKKRESFGLQDKTVCFSLPSEQEFLQQIVLHHLFVLPDP